MKTYKDFGYTGLKGLNTNYEKVNWTKYIILVPSSEDKKEVLDALKHCHDSKDIDTDFITVNQLVHEYTLQDKFLSKYSKIIVDEKIYNDIVKMYDKE